MTDSWRPTADAVAAQLKTIFGGRLRSLVAYGPHIDGQPDAPLTCLALVDSLTVADLDACASVAGEWRRARVTAPLILPLSEFQQSLDAFPLEYGEILRAHTTVYGEDLLRGAAIAAADLRRACETQVKSHLLHLRQSYVEAGGHPTGIANLVAASAPAFGALLRNVARLSGVHSSTRMEATLQGARAAGLSERIVADVLALEQRGRVPDSDPARLFPEYLAAVEQLARAVDAWRAA
jgi:hypothetical protein